MRKIFVTIFLILLFQNFIYASFKYKSGEIILIEKPKALILLDEFKRQLNEEAKENLIDFQPFFVFGIDKSNPLQNLLIIESLGKKYFIALDEKNNIFNRKYVGKIITLTGFKKFKQNKAINKKYHSISFYSIASKKSVKIKLSASLKINFVARKKNKYLVVIDNKIGYVRLPKDFFITDKSRKQLPKLSSETFIEIDKIIKRVNVKIKNLYKTLNEENSGKKVPPYFVHKSQMEYTLINGKLKNFPEVKNYLLSKINLLLLNSGFEALFKNNSIVIARK